MSNILKKLSSTEEAEEAILHLLDIPYISTEKKLDLLTLSWDLNGEILQKVFTETKSEVVKTALSETRERYYFLNESELIRLKCKICGVNYPYVDEMIELLKRKTLSLAEEGKIILKILENSNLTQSDLARILGISRPSISYRIKLASNQDTTLRQRGRPKHQIINFEKYKLPLQVRVKKKLSNQQIAELLRAAASFLEQ